MNPAKTRRWTFYLNLQGEEIEHDNSKRVSRNKNNP